MVVDSVFGQMKEAKNRFTVSFNAAGDHQLICCNFNQVIQMKRSEETEPVFYPNLVPKMAAFDHVPEEVIEEIFSRVPVKSLVRFKTASKKWYSRLSEDYKFAKFHFEQSKKHRLVFFKSHDLNLFQSLNVDTLASREFIIPVEIKVELVGSANGLVCVAPYLERSCFIWNPCTSECKKISMIRRKRTSPTYEWESPTYEWVLGFGYDSFSDDYKIIATDYDKHLRIFSLKTNSWKIIKNDYLIKGKAVHFNGALHWCLNVKIVAFDLAKEVFSYIEIPDEMKVAYRGTYDATMWEYRGFLCASSYKRDIWMMMRYGDSKSWVKLSTSLVNNQQIPLGVSSLGEVVYRARGGFGFVKSDIQGRLSKDDESQLYPSVSGSSYMESLISPKCFDALHSCPKKMIIRPKKMIIRLRKRRKTTAT